jgi:hypothetical protein
MRVRVHIKKHEMRPFIYYVYLAFPGTAKCQLLKLGNTEENLLPEPNIMIFPFVLYKLERCVFLSLGLGRTRLQAGAANNKQEGLEGGETFQDTCTDRFKGMVVVDGMPL